MNMCGAGVWPWRAILVVVFVAFAFLVVGASAATGDTITCGAVITEDTRLDHDLIDCPGDGIVIGADGITLDLGGHVVDGIGSGSPFEDAGIDNTGGYDNVTIRDGSVVGFPTGISLMGTSRNVLRGLDVRENLSTGIYMYGLDRADSVENRIVGNHVSGSTRGAGIYLEGAGPNLLKKNEISGNERGLLLGYGSAGNTVETNTVAANFQGIYVTDFSDANQIKGNSISGNEGAAIAIFSSSRNEVVGNDVIRNGAGIGIGLERAGSSDENAIVRNHIRENGGDGIVVSGPFDYPVPRPGPTGNVVVGNDATENGDDGIDVQGHATLIGKNRANKNGDLGIEAVTEVVDGGGNRAEGNGNPLECVNVVCS
jgi:parallel beta-helix repeat protein